MRLTWKDLAATIFMGASVAAYVAFVQGADLPLVSSVRGTTTVVLVLGVFGGCVLGTTADLYTGTHSTALLAFMVVTTLLGVTALVAGAVALITAGETALAVLLAATITLWAAATARHALGVHGTIGGERTAS